MGDISDTDDPSVTGGTSFLVAMGYKPNKTVRSTITQNGYLRAELTDNTGAPILDLYGNPIAMQNDYNDGDTEVKDPENYTIQIDVKTGAVTIKKK